MQFWIFIVLFLNFKAALAYDFENSNSIILNTNYFSDSVATADKIENDGLLLSENNINFSKNWSLKLSPLLAGTYGSAEKKSRVELDAKEARLTYAGSKLTADFGFLNTKKVGPDLMDPLDYFQPRDWQNPLAARKLSVAGLQIEYEPLKNLALTVAYVPENRISKLPRQTSLWYPRENKLPLSTDDTKAILPENAEYQITSSTAEKKSDAKNNYLIKLKYSISDFDFYLQVSESLAVVPIITPTLTGTLVSINPTEIVLQNPIQLDIVWKKNKNYGAGLVQSFSNYGLIGKFFYNYNLTPDDENQQGVFAIEKQFQDLILVYEFSRAEKKLQTASTALTATNSIFSNTHALAARWSYNDNLKLKFGAFLDANTQGAVALANIEYHFTDNLYAELQRTELTGQKNSLIGLFQNNDMTSFKITALF